MQIVLIAGLWLPRTVWTKTATALEAMGHTVHAVALPGADSLDRRVVLGDQITVVVDQVDHAAELDADGKVLVVGHSAASTLAWVAADRRPNAVSRVAMIGGFPAADGDTYAAFFPLVDGVMPFPGWEPFEGPDSADISEQHKARVAEIAVPVPGGVAEGHVHYTDKARYTVPVTMICPEYSPEEFREWLAAGDLPELTPVQQIDAVDLDTGHWPMISAPDELARVVADLG